MKFKPIDFIKIDVEGMEINVIKGAKKTISKYKPIIFMEVNSIQAAHPILDWSKKNNYAIYGIITPAFNKKNFNNYKNNIFGNAQECGLLIIPSEKLKTTNAITNKLKLPELETLDELALLLLHKPQYPYEILEQTKTAKKIGLDYPSPLLAKLIFNHKENDRLISTLKTKLSNKDAAIKKYEDEIIEKNDTMKKYEDEIIEKNDALEKTTKIKTKLSLSLKKELARTQSLLQKNKEFILQIESLNSKIIEKNKDLDKFKKIIHVYKKIRLILKSIYIKSPVDTSNIYWQRKIITPYFDEKYYTQSYRDVLTSPIDHFLIYGWKEGRNPSKNFDTQMYLRRHLDVTDSKINPLVHYAFWGKKEGRVISKKTTYDIKESKFRIPKLKNPKISVILPVYRDIKMTLSCINSALPNIIEEKNTLIIINDASPENGMHHELENIANKHPKTIILLENKENLGFVKTVNIGLKKNILDDVILLNSDVIVPKKWLKRLSYEAYTSKKIATVTPLSNNTTICTFPEFLQENPIPFKLNTDEVDSAFEGFRLNNTETPTGIGFCMFIKRECLNEIGYLDEINFLRGYGEENNFCQRAINSGWKNVITPNIYVYHKGGVSFGHERKKLMEEAMKTIQRLHPNYNFDIHQFIALDPLKKARITRFLKLISIQSMPKVLHISHGLGGGIAQHIEELSNSFNDDIISLLLTPNKDMNKITIQLNISKHSDNLTINLPSQYKILVELLKTIKLSGIHYHHMMKLHPLLIKKLPEDIKVPHIITIHDFYLLNGNPTLTNKNYIFPGKYDDNIKNPLYPLPNDTNPLLWREKFRTLIEGAKVVIFPSDSTRILFGKHFNLDRAITSYHLEENRNSTTTPPEKFMKKINPIYKIGVIGAIGKEKGADFLEEIGIEIKKHHLPIQIVIIGYAYRKLQNIEATGPYNKDHLKKIIHENKFDIIFFPARCPETYSYTLSYALDSGLPIIAPNLGSFPERLSEREHTFLFNHLASAKTIALELKMFIKSLTKGDPCTSKKYITINAISKNFYFKKYQKTFTALKSRTIHSEENNKIKKYVDQLYSREDKTTLTIKEKIASILWVIYNHPKFYFIQKIVPYKTARSVKNLLTKRSIYEIYPSHSKISHDIEPKK